MDIGEEVAWPTHCRACTHEQIDHRAAYGPCQREDCECRQWSHRAPRLLRSWQSGEHHGFMKRVDYLDGWFLEVDSEAFRIESPAGSLTLSREELDDLLAGT